MDDTSADPATPADADDGVATVLPFPKMPGPRDVADAPRLRDALGEVLREERTAQDRTLADVADAANLSLPYLSEVERGRKDVSSDLLTSICDALELPVPLLLERTAERLRIGLQRGSSIQLLAA